MKSTFAVGARLSAVLWVIGAVVGGYLPAPGVVAAQGSTSTPQTTIGAPDNPQRFDTPQQAASALIEAAAKFNAPALVRIFGRDGQDIVLTGETPRDRQRAANFAAAAKEKTRISVDQAKGYAYLIVGNQDWPFPAPLVKRGSQWAFDIATARQELLYRYIGANELDAITICRGYVDVQYQYAYQTRQGYGVHQYAQRLISTSGTHDGLAWRNPDGTWGGPMGENVARALAQGYSGSRTEPFHGYYFKILTGQGPAAPLGAMNFVVKGAMIGGFGLAAAPAKYRVTGVKTFIVSYEGIVYQKDLGPNTLEIFKNMTLYNPDKTWQRTDDNWPH